MCTSYDSFLFVAGILLIVASVINGSTENLNGQLFAGTDSVMNIKSVLGVAVLSPFYSLVIIAVGLLLNPEAIRNSQAITGLVSADAMAVAFGTPVMAKVVILGGMCGIITSWNSFMIGGSRAMYSMAESYMIPRLFAKLHTKHKTPVNALILIGVLTMLAPFAGRVMMVWICDAGNYGCCFAYCMGLFPF